MAARSTSSVSVSHCQRFSITGEGFGFTARQLWEQVEELGRLDPGEDRHGAGDAGRHSLTGTAIGGAVAATVRVPPGGQREVHFSLAWDAPIAKFGRHSSYLRSSHLYICSSPYSCTCGCALLTSVCICVCTGDTQRRMEGMDRRHQSWPTMR